MNFFFSPLLIAENIIDIELAQKIKETRKNLVQSEKALEEMVKEVDKLEKLLSNNNEKFVQVIRLKSNIEKEIFDFKKLVNDEKRMLQREKTKVEKMLEVALLRQLEASSSPSMILAEKIVLERMSQNLASLHQALNSNRLSREKLQQLELRYEEYSDVEKELMTLLENLERRRESQSNKYLSQISQKDLLQAEYESLKTKVFLTSHTDMVRAREQVGGIKFSMPLESFYGMQHDKRGVTFKYNGNQNVLNSAKGEVVYIGSLSTYGTVVMVDHGSDTRSVYLGHFKPDVKTGSMLERGEVIGQTTTDRGAQEIYFDVRKHDQVQNTILLLDHELLLASVLD